MTADGYEVIEVSLPALITISNELGEPRYPKITGIMAAKKKEPIIWKPADIGLDASQKVAGENPEEAGVNLALKLREAKIL